MGLLYLSGFIFYFVFIAYSWFFLNKMYKNWPFIYFILSPIKLILLLTFFTLIICTATVPYGDGDTPADGILLIPHLIGFLFCVLAIMIPYLIALLRKSINKSEEVFLKNNTLT